MPAQEAPREAVVPPPARVVIPHRLSLGKRLLASLAYWVIRTLAATLRYEWHHAPELLSTPSPVIFCTWHNRLALALILYDDYARRLRRPYRMAAIVSASRDGAVLAHILEHFGVQPVRGSSSRRGPQALLELTTWAERGYDLAITPDGPRGPRYVVQDGAVALAQVTGLPAVPASYTARWKFCMKSWDRFQIPLPFSRVIVRVGEPLWVPRDATAAERESLRATLEARLRNLAED